MLTTILTAIVAYKVLELLFSVIVLVAVAIGIVSLMRRSTY